MHLKYKIVSCKPPFVFNLQLPYSVTELCLTYNCLIQPHNCFCLFDFFQARIAFLQGERKGQENLKQDLVRRIKMLEFALKQERYI